MHKHWGGLVGVHSELRPQRNWSQGHLHLLPSLLSVKNGGEQTHSPELRHFSFSLHWLSEEHLVLTAVQTLL